MKKSHGTIHYTTVAGFANVPGFTVPCLVNGCALDVTCGSITRKASVLDGELATREVLSVTLMFNHAIIDGAPAARFVRRLKQILENAEVLDEAPPGPGPSVPG